MFSSPIVVSIVSLSVSLCLSFWGWLAIKVIEQGRKLVELEQKVLARDNECNARLSWLHDIDKKIDTANTGIAEIQGYIKAQQKHKEN